MYSPETLSRITILRSKIAEGTITKEEMKEGVALIREGRASAAASSDQAKRAKARKAIPSADELLDQLTGG